MSSSRLYSGPLARMFREEGAMVDPWSAEVDAEVRRVDVVPLCPNCLSPQNPHPHNCAFPTGDCVAAMHYLNVFVVGEHVRQGVTGPQERRWGVQAFFDRCRRCAIFGLRTGLLIFAVASGAWPSNQLR